MKKSSKDIDLIIYSKYQTFFNSNLEDNVKSMPQCTYDQVSSQTLSKGMSEGKKLVILKITIDGEEFDLDLRETDNKDNLDDDMKTRDFTINSLYMWFEFENEKYHVIYPQNVRFHLKNIIFLTCIKGELDIIDKRMRTTNSIELTFSDPSRILRLIRFLSSEENWLTDPQLQDYLMTKAHPKLLEGENKFVFCAEMHKVFCKKDSKQWIKMCCLMIKYNLYTINITVEEEDREELALKVREKLEQFDSLDIFSEYEPLKIEELRTLVYAISLLYISEEMRFNEKEYTRMAKPMIKKKTLRQKFDEKTTKAMSEICEILFNKKLIKPNQNQNAGRNSPKDPKYIDLFSGMEDMHMDIQQGPRPAQAPNPASP